MNNDLIAKKIQVFETEKSEFVEVLECIIHM